MPFTQPLSSPPRTLRRFFALMRRLPGALALLAALAAGARAQQPLPPDWDFTLPALDGGRFVTASKEPGPLLINFWSADCAPCLAELPLLQALADEPGRWRVLLVTADAPADAARAMQRVGVALPVVRGGKGLAALMRAAGNTRGVLPFTVLMADGRLCANHAGALDAQSLAALLASCPGARQEPV